jgi:hypothetical protein
MTSALMFTTTRSSPFTFHLLNGFCTGANKRRTSVREAPSKNLSSLSPLSSLSFNDFCVDVYDNPLSSLSFNDFCTDVYDNPLFTFFSSLFTSSMTSALMFTTTRSSLFSLHLTSR